jgi:acylphosphatase
MNAIRVALVLAQTAVLSAQVLAAASAPATNPATGPATAPATRPAVVRVHVLVSGKVQGVGFRDFVQQKAAALGLSGWVRNLADGRVEAVVEGPADRVEQLVQAMRKGPARASVSGVESTPEKPTGEFNGFEVTR